MFLSGTARGRLVFCQMNDRYCKGEMRTARISSNLKFSSGEEQLQSLDRREAVYPLHSLSCI